MTGGNPRRPRGHGARSKGREIALKYLFGIDLRDRKEVEDFDAFIVHQEARGPAVAFARHLVQGILENWDRFDDLVGSVARNWTLKRMATIDRNILRIGCYEFACHPDTPAGVIINEAVELAKKFGSNDSGKFVNGVLDRVRARRDAEGDLLFTPPAETTTDPAPREL